MRFDEVKRARLERSAFVRRVVDCGFDRLEVNAANFYIDTAGQRTLLLRLSRC